MSELAPPVLEAQAVFPEPPENGITYGGSRLLFRSAARHFGVELASQEDYDWLVVIEASMLVDHLADVEKVDIETPFKEIVAGNIRADLDRDIQVRTVNYFSRQSQKQREIILENIRTVSDLAVAQRNSTMVRDVIEIRITEADILSSLLALSTLNTPDADARHAFNKWLGSWSRAGYLLDSFFDVAEDYSSENSGVEPTLRSRASFFTAASKESVTAVKRTPPQMLGKCMLGGINSIVRQRRPEVQPVDLLNISSES